MWKHTKTKKEQKKDKQGNLIPLTQPELLNTDSDTQAEEQYEEENT